LPPRGHFFYCAKSAGGTADYQNYANPNGIGIQADAISRLGLDKGQLSDTNQSRGYNAYQSRLAAAGNEKQKRWRGAGSVNQ
jgi:hypothetical protein